MRTPRASHAWKIMALGAGLLGMPLTGYLVGGCNAVLGIDAATSNPLLGTDGGFESVDSGGLLGDGGDVPLDVPDSPYALDCASYCALSLRACTRTTDEAGAPQDNTEYIDPSTCVQMCNVAYPKERGGLVPVEPAPPSANTLACRIWHTNYGIDHGLQEHCPHGGPLGGETCGDLTTACNAFCTLAAHFCSEVYETPEVCNRACLPNDAGAGGFPYRIGTGISDLDQAGSNTLNCRIYHLQAAITYDKALHCPHIAAKSSVCFDPAAGPVPLAVPSSTPGP